MKLNEAITIFSDWDKPWLFAEKVEALIEKTEINEFRILMSEATNEENWKDMDLILGCKVTHQKLKANFSYLSDKSIGAVVRAVSFQWK